MPQGKREKHKGTQEQEGSHKPRAQETSFGHKPRAATVKKRKKHQTSFKIHSERLNATSTINII